MRRNVVSIVLSFGIVACGGGDGGPSLTTHSPVPTALVITSSTDLLKINQSASVHTHGHDVRRKQWHRRRNMEERQSGRSHRRFERPRRRAPDRARPRFRRSRTDCARRRGPFACCRTIKVVGRGDWRARAAARPTETGPERTSAARCPSASLLPFALALTQDRDTAAGNATLDDVVGPVQGSDSHLAVSWGVAGAFTVTDEGITLDVTVTDWDDDDDRQPADDRPLCPRYFARHSLQGSVRFDGELRTVAKSSATPLSPAGGPHHLRRALAAITRR